MFAGVAKSGSPSAKSRTSTPSALRRLASAAIANVAEGAIKFDRSASFRAIATTLRGNGKQGSAPTDPQGYHGSDPTSFPRVRGVRQSGAPTDSGGALFGLKLRRRTRAMGNARSDGRTPGIRSNRRPPLRAN